jgi:hypothetical protein
VVLARAHLGTGKQGVFNDPLVQGDFTDLRFKFDQRDFYPFKLFIAVKVLDKLVIPIVQL